MLKKQNYRDERTLNTTSSYLPFEMLLCGNYENYTSYSQMHAIFLHSFVPLQHIWLWGALWRRASCWWSHKELWPTSYFSNAMLKWHLCSLWYPSHRTAFYFALCNGLHGAYTCTFLKCLPIRLNVFYCTYLEGIQYSYVSIQLHLYSGGVNFATVI